MTVDGPLVTLGLAAVAVIVWLVRLEGRVNAQAEQSKAEIVRLDKEMLAANARVEAESRAHRGTSDALIRLEEAVKHLTRLFEQHFAVTASSASRRRPKAGGEE
jgi:hypothetical protein